MAVCGACRVDVGVELDVGARGHGTLSVVATLDAAAVEAIGDVGQSVAVGDLRKAGWAVDPVVARGGGAVLRARHRFSNAAQVSQLMGDLGGGFSGVTVRQQRSFLRTTTSLRGQVDLGRGLASFSDPALQEALDGSPSTPLGVAEDRLLDGKPASEVFGLDVEASLPGRDAVRWDPVVGGPPVSLTASATQWNVGNLASVAVAVAAAFALAMVLLRYRG
jgi:hypothetical protein